MAFLAACTADAGGPSEPSEPPPPGSVSGVVTDPFDTALAGATVGLTGSGSQTATATTSSDGSFSFDDVEPGSYDVEASRSGFRPASIPVAVTSNATSTINLALDPQSAPSAGTLRTSVTDWGGAEMQFDVDIAVISSDARAVTTLSPSDFTLSDFDVLQFQSRGRTLVGASGAGPYSAALLLDQSGSITSTDPNDSRIQATKIFLDALGSGDNVTLAAFSSSGNLPYEPVTLWGSGFQADGRLYFGVLDELAGSEGGGTPLYRSIRILIDYTWENAPNANRAVVVFTDGEDTDGGSTVDDVIFASHAAGVPVYTVGLSNQVDFRVLSEIANETGGAMMWAGDARQLVSLYGTLGSILRGSIEFYRTRWTARRVDGSNWGNGGYISSAVAVQTSEGTVYAPFFVEIDGSGASTSATGARPSTTGRCSGGGSPVESCVGPAAFE